MRENRSIEINPKDAQAYSGRGLAKYQLNDKQGAIMDISTATELYRLQGNTAKYQEGLKVINILIVEGS